MSDLSYQSLVSALDAATIEVVGQWVAAPSVPREVVDAVNEMHTVGEIDFSSKSIRKYILRKKACGLKIGWPTRARARKAASTIGGARRKAGRMQQYRCPHCGLWHNGRAKK